MPITLKVNGRSASVDVSGDTPLLWALRDTLDLVGTKYGCGMAQCGACTVHLNGAAVRSCSTPVSAAAGADATTIEGLSKDASHPVQRAWQEQDVAQCGYRQAGQIMHAAALLRQTPNPTDAQIDAKMAEFPLLRITHAPPVEVHFRRTEHSPTGMGEPAFSAGRPRAGERDLRRHGRSRAHPAAREERISLGVMREHS